MDPAASTTNPESETPKVSNSERSARTRVAVIVVGAILLFGVIRLLAPSAADWDGRKLQEILNREPTAPLNAIDVSVARVIVSKYAARIASDPNLAALTIRANMIARDAAYARINHLPAVDQVLIRDVVAGWHNNFHDSGIPPRSLLDVFDVFDVDLPAALHTADERKAKWRKALQKADGYALEPTGTRTTIALVHHYNVSLGANQVPQRDVIVTMAISDAEIVSKALTPGSG